jgi:hypothetical protein
MVGAPVPVVASEENCRNFHWGSKEPYTILHFGTCNFKLSTKPTNALIIQCTGIQ